VSVWATPAERARLATLPFVARLVPVAHAAQSLQNASDPRPGVVPPPEFVLANPADAHTNLDHAPLWATAAAGLAACGLDGRGVWVAVLDTGVVLTHPALRHLDVRDRWDFLDQDNDLGQGGPVVQGAINPQVSHGTAVLSLLAGHEPGRFRAVAPAVSLLLARVEDMAQEVRAEEDAFVAALEWAEAKGADIVTASVGYPAWYAPTELDGATALATLAVNAAIARGVVVVVAAGNLGPEPSSLCAPADAAGALTIGSILVDGTLAASSGRGPTADGRVKPDLVAPGVAVWAATVDAGYIQRSGTSFAAPHVAGIAALLLQAEPTLSPVALAERLRQSASRADAPDFDRGFGVPNAVRALGDACTVICGAPCSESAPSPKGCSSGLGQRKTSVGLLAACVLLLARARPRSRRVGGPSASVTVHGGTARRVRILK
jgi:subtilisin family serine protease